MPQFVEALSRWSAAHPVEQVEFLLAGEGPLRNALGRIPIASNLRLNFLGPVAYEDLPGVYAQAGVFAFPTLVDTWGVVVNEALAAGLPVLGSIYAQAVTELVRPGSTGWTFRPDCPDEMYQALEQCLATSDEALEQMRAEARQTALRLTPDFVTDLIEDAIRACTNSAESRAAHA